MVNSPLTDCIQARESISAQLDEELPELEFERVRVHLRGCADCAGWAEQVAAAALYMREAPVETPAAPVFVAKRSRRRAAAPLAIAAAAAATFVAAFGSSASVGLRQSAAPGRAAQPAADATVIRTIEERRLGPESRFTSSQLPLIQHGMFRAV